MIKSLVRVGPQDHGRRMSLDDFDRAEVQEGYLYELSQGVVTVSEVPARRHLAQVRSLRQQLAAYELANPGHIDTVAGSNECKILLTELESERHPDLAIYKNPPEDDEDLWATWVPEIVVEVVSPGSEQRDYAEKRGEYFTFGVREYWNVDADKQEVLILRRRGGRWVERILRPSDTYRTKLLPGFELACGPIFEAAEALSGS